MRTALGIGAWAIAALLSACGGRDAVPPDSGGARAALDPTETIPPALAAMPKGADAQAIAVPTSDLVRAGTVGDVPAAANRIDVAVTADGTLVAGGRERDLEGLRDHLREVTRGPATRRVDGTSRLYGVLRIHPSLPWEVTVWVLQAFADPQVKVYRILFAVRPEDGDEEGAMATHLPQARDHGWRPWIPDAPGPVTVEVVPAEGETSAGAVVRALEPLLRAPKASKRATLSARPGVATGHVLRMVDWLLRSGAVAVDFVGVPVPRERSGAAAPAREGKSARTGLQDYVAEHPVRAAGFAVRIRGTEVGGDATAPAPPAVARVRGRFAGSFQEAGEEQEESPTARTAPAPDPGQVVEDEVPPEPEETEQVHPATEKPGREPSVPDVAGSNDGVTSGPALLRGQGTRPRKAEDPVDRGLAWLAAHQSPDGGWEAAGFPQWCDGKPRDGDGPGGPGQAQHDVGVTGLALLAFLGAGYTQRSEGPYGKVVGNGMRYLKNVQDAEGCFGARANPHFVYGHAIAALAMLEAYGMTRTPIYSTSAQRALDFVALARNPYFAWRYGVKPGDNDTSITCWMTLALVSARLQNAADEKAGKPPSLAIDSDAFEGVNAWLDKMTDPDTGRVGYQQRGSGPARPAGLTAWFPAARSESTTAMGVAMRLLLGEDAGTSVPVRRGLDLIRALPPRWDARDGSIDFAYWHFATIATFLAGGEDWRSWEGYLKAAVIDTQRTDGAACDALGSWDPVDAWSHEGGRVYATALLTMTLEIYYRYGQAFPRRR